MPSAPVIESPCVPWMMMPARAASGHSSATTKARAVVRRRDCKVGTRTIFGALGLKLFPARNTGRGPRREQVFPARFARQKLTVILYIVLLIQLFRFSCVLLFPSLPRIYWQSPRYLSSSL